MLRAGLLAILLAFLGCHSNAAPVLHCSSFRGVHVNGLLHKDFAENVDGICGNLFASLNDVECPAISFLMGSFGEEQHCLDIILASLGEREALIEIYATNGPCWRHGTCDVGDVLNSFNIPDVNEMIVDEHPQAIEEFTKRYQEIADIAAKLPPNVHLAVSPGLEDQFSDQAFQKLIAFQRRMLPNAIGVRNPIHSTELSGADVFETHGIDQHCDEQTLIVSQDGEVTNDDAAFLTRTNSCLASFLWRPEWQGRTRGADGTLTEAAESPRLRRMNFSKSDALEINALLKKSAGMP